MASLDLALIGNGTIGALVDAGGSVVWCCFPRFDGDPAFCSLLAGDSPGDKPGTFSIELEGAVRTEQEYITDTPILVTRFYDKKDGGVEITDFCPRFERNGEMFCPGVLVRQVRPIGEKPSIRLRVEPAIDYGCTKRRHALGAGHISYAGPKALKLTTDAPVGTIVDGAPIQVRQTITLMFGLDDATGTGEDVTSEATTMLERTTAYWRNWTQSLDAPSEWRDAAIRGAITLQLHAYEATGAIIPATTTSIPEAPKTGRNWDYRYCWPRDAYFTADALARLGDLRTVERFLSFLLSVAEANKGRLVPIYSIDGRSIPNEHVAECLQGYRGMGPVRIGNKASEQAQNDLYGEAVLTAAPVFLSSDARGIPDEFVFRKLEAFGHHAVELYATPDAGLWELRGAERVHTYSSIMCWAACDRLARYASRLNLGDRAEYWRIHAASMHEVIAHRSWNATLNAFTATMEGDSLDASLLLMPRLGFLEATDPRFVGTVEAIEKHLKHGDFIYRYVERDDFGFPENAFLVCTFWYIEALAAMGGARREQARALFEKVLSARNRHGLLAEDLDTRTLEQWGNFPQTYCMAGIIDCAIALGK
jgi:GH15 family glucan-1,4-alpha-glucosidase